MQSKAKTPDAYLDSLPVERQQVMQKLRRAIKTNLPKGFEETMDYGMLAYVVPLSSYPSGYHCKPGTPLPFINLASQKQYVAVHHMGLYDEKLLSWLQREWAKHTDAKLDLGKCCLRLKKLDEVPYELIGQLAKKVSPKQWIAMYEKSRSD